MKARIAAFGLALTLVHVAAAQDADEPRKIDAASLLVIDVFAGRANSVKQAFTPSAAGRLGRSVDLMLADISTDAGHFVGVGVPTVIHRERLVMTLTGICSPSGRRRPAVNEQQAPPRTITLVLDGGELIDVTDSSTNSVFRWGKGDPIVLPLMICPILCATTSSTTCWRWPARTATR